MHKFSLPMYRPCALASFPARNFLNQRLKGQIVKYLFVAIFKYADQGGHLSIDLLVQSNTAEVKTTVFVFLHMTTTANLL